MNLTFGICTTYDDPMRLLEVVESIQALNIPHVEILIAGSYHGTNDPVPQGTGAVRHILTDGWTPKKKNLIAKFAQHETLVLLHDYYLFDSSWYREFVKFGTEWDVCLNPQYLITGKRHFTDWVCWDSPIYPRYHSLPYEDWSHTRHQYVSGGFFLVKRDFLRLYPFNEEMLPGSPEDVEWSLRIRERAVMKCNPLSIVRHNKVHRDAK